MHKTIRDNPGEVTLVPIGPLTNIATALVKDPTIKNENLFISENHLKKLQADSEIDSIETILQEIGSNA